MTNQVVSLNIKFTDVPFISAQHFFCLLSKQGGKHQNRKMPSTSVTHTEFHNQRFITQYTSLLIKLRLHVSSFISF